MKEILKKLNACNEAIEWVQDRKIEEAINECPRGDWMLWLFKKLYPDDLQLLTLTKSHCANTVRHLMKDKRSIKAVDAAILFGEGKITKEELIYAAASAANASYASYAANASSAANTSSSAAYVADAASYASYAAASAVAAAYDAAVADAAASADDAASSAAYVAYASSDDAKKANRLQTANICRKYLGDKLIKGLKYINNEQQKTNSNRMVV